MSMQRKPETKGFHQRGGKGEQQRGLIDDFVKELSKYLEGDDTMTLVNKLFEGNMYNELGKEIKSESSYRRVHELLSSIIDDTELLLNQGQSSDFIRSRLSTDLARASVFIRYQEARGQLGKGIAKILNGVIDEIYKNVSNGSVLRKVLSNARVLIDALAVIAKEKG
jgi:hypothetical protein